jgi:hypothetical protein
MALATIFVLTLALGVLANKIAGRLVLHLHSATSPYSHKLIAVGIAVAMMPWILAIPFSVVGMMGNGTVRTANWVQPQPVPEFLANVAYFSLILGFVAVAIRMLHDVVLRLLRPSAS